jgi:hypothetical protein
MPRASIVALNTPALSTITLDDIALYVPTTKKTSETRTLTPLTHGHVLYAAWALSLVTMKEPMEMLLRNLSPLAHSMMGNVIGE